MSQMLEPDLSVVELRSYFVRKRNALLVRGRFSPLYLDYYLHLMQHAIQHEEALDQMLKDGLAAIALHLCSRPQDEGCAWTVHVKEPQRANLFVTGSTHSARITGRIFTEDVRQEGEALFVSQTTRPETPVRQSMTEFKGSDMIAAVEDFYTTSEQRPTRIFRLLDEEFVQVSAEPDCDVAWLSALTLEDIVAIEQHEHLTLLETRGYRFECGCSMERLMPIIMRLPQDDLDHIFADGMAVITCPRCGAVFRTPKASFEEWRSQQA